MISPFASAPTALVTGASGFIGGHLVEALLSDGWNVRALLRRPPTTWIDTLAAVAARLNRQLEILSGPITDPDTVHDAARGSDTIFHLAACTSVPASFTQPYETMQTNVAGTLHVLEAARRHDTRRVVHVSSSEVYGPSQALPIAETHPLHGCTPYAVSKIAADQLVVGYNRAFALPTVTIRPFNTFGPRQSSRAVIPSIIEQALGCDEIRIGALAPTRDFTYVSDTVAGLMRAAYADDRVLGREFNLGTGIETSIADLADLILDNVGRDQRIRQENERVRPHDSDALRVVADNRRAKEILGWRPEVSLETGIRLTIDWWRNRPLPLD